MTISSLYQVFVKLKEEKRLTDEIASSLLEKYDERFLRALDLVNARKVKKYIFRPSGVERWVVFGMHGEYLVIPRSFCQCDDFYISVVVRKSKDTCYHLIAQTIAEALGNYEEEILDDSEYSNFMRKFHEI
ncbi:MAG: hypothetical protein DRJ26_00745 [Candidatus Methanomethylicota archaeon]|uniref:SWIM-type domain-containing protein n=1 Tax=Thermoproteota archaeon TaxID=2056631 RepID=A0A497F8E0_9CREN|nr:MAG: hypothetical protein DRJ26_00745 [Candidatus Verstraetearchaeota archaeon]